MMEASYRVFSPDVINSRSAILEALSQHNGIELAGI